MTPLVAWASVFSGYTTNSAGQPLAGYNGYFAVDSIPGLYYQVVNPNDTSQVAITTVNMVGNSGPPLIMGDSTWTPCANYIGPAASCSYSKTASQYSQIPLKIRVNFIKFGQLVPGDYDMNSHYLFHFLFASLPNDNHSNAEDVRLSSGILVFRVKTNCELDTTSTNLSVDFGDFDDEGVAVGQRLVPYDKDFEIGFHGCADSVLPAVTWDLHPEDSLDSQNNFPTFTPDVNSRVSAGIGFKLFDTSAGQFTPITPGLQRTLTDTAANIVVDGKMRYPANQTTVRWPFAVRLIKSGTVPLGTFGGRATFTIAYP